MLRKTLTLIQTSERCFQVERRFCRYMLKNCFVVINKAKRIVKIRMKNLGKAFKLRKPRLSFYCSIVTTKCTTCYASVASTTFWWTIEMCCIFFRKITREVAIKENRSVKLQSMHLEVLFQELFDKYRLLKWLPYVFFEGSSLFFAAFDPMLPVVLLCSISSRIRCVSSQ